MSRYFPWNPVSTETTDLGTSQEVIESSGLDYRLESQPMFLKYPSGDDGGIPVVGREISKKRAVVRMDTGVEVGVVGSDYQIIQNRECFSFFDHLVQDGKARYVAAGELDGGTRIFIVARIEGDMILRHDDVVAKYLLLSAAHDGTSSVRAEFIPYRLVCTNGMVADIPNLRRKVKVVHSRGYQTAMNKARQVLGTADHYFDTLGRMCEDLLGSQVDGQEFVEKLLPSPSSRAGNVRSKILELMDSGTGMTHIRDTKWAAWNAVAEYTDHHMTVSARKFSHDESKFNSVLSGGAAHKLKNRALNILTSPDQEPALV